MNKYLLSALLTGTILSGSVAFADDYEILKGNKDVLPGETIVQTGGDNIFHVEGISRLRNWGDLETETGNIFHMDTHPDYSINLSGSSVYNYGTMVTNGTGHAVYAYPLPNQRSTTYVYNYGDMYRIELSETGKDAAAAFGDGSQVRNYEGATLRGSVRLGTYATLENWGHMVGLDNDDKENFAVNNLIYFDKTGILRNGFKETIVSVNPQRLWVDLTPSAEINTNNIVFGQNGTLYNAGIIDNESILATDKLENEYQSGVKIYLMNNPYYETDEVVYDDDGKINREKSHLLYYVEQEKEEHPDKVAVVAEKPVLHTHKVSLGDDALLRADQGSDIAVTESFEVDKNGQVDIGAYYYWKSGLYKDDMNKQSFNWDRDVIVSVEQAEEIEYEEEVDGTTIHRTKYVLADSTPEERSLNAIPLRSSAMISKIKTGENANFTVYNTDMSNTYSDELGEIHVGSSYTFGENSTFNVTGSYVDLYQDDGVVDSGKLIFEKNGVLNVSGYWQDKISYSDDRTKLERDTDSCPSGMTCVKPGEYVESVWPADESDQPIQAIIHLEDDLIMGDRGQITLTGIEPHTDDSDADAHHRMGNSGKTEAAIELDKNMILGKYNTLTLGGGEILGDYNKTEIILDDHSTIQTADQTTNYLIAKTIKFGDFGTFRTSQPWDSDGDNWIDRYSMDVILKEKMFFGNDGYFDACDGGIFWAEQLNMLDRAEVHVGTDLVTQTIVGSDSNVYLDAATTRGGSFGITRGLLRQDGAENITLYSGARNMNRPDDRKKIFNENYVLGIVDVDDIYITSGGLRLGSAPEGDEGDIHGEIHMASDTWVRFTGNKVIVHDPIGRDGNATNTLVWIDVDDTAVIDTHNTIDSDVVMIGGGTLNVHHEVTAPEVVLDDAGALRVYNDDLVKADVMEYETTAANTTLFIKPDADEMDSFGSVQLDRLVVENGGFNAYHPILAAADGTRESTEGIWLGTGASINTYNNVRTSQLIRRQDITTGPVTNTTARLMRGSFVVDRHTDIDNLILKSGTFNFRNTGNVEAPDLERDMIVTNDVYVEDGVNLLVDGTDHPNSGKVIINGGYGNLVVEKGGRLGLSNTNLTASDDHGQMNINANLFLNAGSTLDLRTSDAGSDLLRSTGRVDLANNIRLIVRNMKESTPYHLVHADGGVNKPDDFQLSFRWHDTDFYVSGGRDLYLNVGHITTLKEELEAAGVSNNVLGIGGYISDNWDGSYGPWDDIFYATNVNDAVKAVMEYVPDGYVAAPQVALRTSQNFQNVMSGELGAMRRLRQMGTQRNRYAPSLQDRRPVYRGRAGGDRYENRPVYQPYVRNKYQAYTPDYSSSSSMNIQRKGSYRTNKGGLWAKPFYVTATQDSDKGISGYDYDAYGLALGLDHRFGQWTWGLAGVYARGNFEQDNSVIESDVDTLGVGIYGSFKPSRSGFFTDLFASYVRNANKATHKIQAARTKLKSSYDTTSLGAGIAFGYDFALAQSLYLTPKIGFNYARLSSDEMKEKGNAPLLLRVKNPNVDSMQLPVELRVAFPVSAKRFELLPELHVRYTHDFGDTEYHAKAYPNGSKDAIELDNVGSPENLFTAGGGLSYISGAHELSGYYDYDFGDGLTSHIFNVGY